MNKTSDLLSRRLPKGGVNMEVLRLSSVSPPYMIYLVPDYSRTGVTRRTCMARYLDPLSSQAFISYELCHKLVVD